MNIAFVNNRYGFWGGVEKYIYQTGKLLIQSGHNVCGIFENAEWKDKDFEQVFSSWIKYEDHPIEAIEKELGRIDLIVLHKISNIKLLKLLQDHYKTIVVIHDHDYYCVRRHKYFPFSRKNCQRSFNLSGCSICTGLLEKSKGRFPVKLINIFAREQMLKSISNTDIQIVLSDYMRQNLISNGFDAGKIRKIHPFITRGPKREYLPHKPANLLYIGQLIRGKGIDLLLEACRYLNNPYRLNILGQGNDEDYIRSLIIKYELSETVSLVGFSLEVDKYYQETDIVVVPSRWQEPFGLIGIEAFDHGKPVVAFNVGGISEWLEDGVNGLLAEDKNAVDLAKKIDKLIEDPSTASKMGNSGYRLLEKEYSAQEFLLRFKEILEELDV